jgi:two-component system cell cycle sensor histidine kinase/response regulator CckA
MMGDPSLGLIFPRPRRGTHAEMKHAQDAILLLDTQYRIREANGQTQDLLGRSRDEIVGRRYEELVFPDERDHVADCREQLMATGSIRLGERHLIGREGARVSVEVSGSLVSLGEETVVLFVLRDIGERQHAERELRAVQERLQRVVSSSPAVLYTLRVDGERLIANWVSANIQEVIGYAPGEISGDQWWRERVHPDDRARMFGQVPELLSVGHVSREYRFRAADGSYRWIRDEQKLLRDAAGAPVEVVGSWWDVGDRKQAELLLEKSEQKYRLLFEANPHPMFVYDVETLAFLAVNEAALREYGYSQEEFLGMTARDIRPSEDVPRFLEILESRAPGPFATESLARHRRRDGTIVEVEIRSNPITFQGRDARLVLVTDVTEKRKLEDQLMQAQKMEAVGRLAGGVAHDFNNLLGIITGYSELLLRDLGTGHSSARRAQEIHKAAERAAKLTKQLLAFSRKQLLEPRVLDLNGVVADVDSMLRRLIGEDVQLVTVLGPDLGRVRADPGQLEQVILNLAVNARDAMPQGGRLTVETSNVSIDASYSRLHSVPAGPYVMLSVGDTGHGIDGQTLSHIFEPFFTTRGQGKGTGLGLSMVFGIVTQSGGHIGVESELGAGSTFKVYLPRVGAEEEPRRGQPIQQAMPRATETILLVEDAEALGLMVREVLEDAGYVVLHAVAPPEAIAAAGSHDGPIHLLLTDVVMPGMSGREVGERVSAARPGVHVLYMSGYTAEAIGQHGVADPGTHFIQKPFTGDGLLRKVRDVLDARS